MIIVIVSFMKLYVDSTSLKSVLSQLMSETDVTDIKLTVRIYDNSPSQMLNHDEISLPSWISDFDLIHTPENLPLREIYNREIENSLNNYNETLLFLDDDTLLPGNFLSSVFSALKENKDTDLFIPKIVVHNRLYSPYKSYLFLGRPFKNLCIGQIPSKNVGAINSGMVIRNRFFRETGFRYPEYSTFYGTDTVFMKFYSVKRHFLYVVDLNIEHDVSFHPQNTSAEKYFQSLNKVTDFWRLHYKQKPFLYLLYLLYVFLSLVKTSVKNKNLGYIFKFFNRK